MPAKKTQKEQWTASETTPLHDGENQGVRDQKAPQKQQSQDTSAGVDSELLTHPATAEEHAMHTIPDKETIEALILNRVTASMAVGLVPVPALDIAVLSAIQVEMLWKLSRAYNLPFSAEWGKKAVAVVLVGVLPGVITPGITSLMRYIPFVGTGLSALSTPLLNAAATYAVGHAFARHFARGGTFLTLDIKHIMQEIKDNFDAAKEVVRRRFKKPAPAQAAS